MVLPHRSGNIITYVRICTYVFNTNRSKNQIFLRLISKFNLRARLTTVSRDKPVVWKALMSKTHNMYLYICNIHTRICTSAHMHTRELHEHSLTLTTFSVVVIPVRLIEISRKIRCGFLRWRNERGHGKRLISSSTYFADTGAMKLPHLTGESMNVSSS